MSINAKDILDRARSHMKGQPIKKITVPEWPDADGNPTVIYAGPLTLHERNQIYKGARADDLSIFVQAIILKAMDAEGRKLFTIEHKQALLREVDSDLVTRIGSAILGTETRELEVEQIAGN